MIFAPILACFGLPNTLPNHARTISTSQLSPGSISCLSGKYQLSFPSLIETPTIWPTPRAHPGPLVFKSGSNVSVSMERTLAFDKLGSIFGDTQPVSGISGMMEAILSALFRGVVSCQNKPIASCLTVPSFLRLHHGECRQKTCRVLAIKINLFLLPLFQ